MSPLPHTRECDHEGIPVFLFGVFFLSQTRSSAADGSASPARLRSRGFFFHFFFCFSDELPDFNPEK